MMQKEKDRAAVISREKYPGRAKARAIQRLRSLDHSLTVDFYNEREGRLILIELQQILIELLEADL